MKARITRRPPSQRRTVHIINPASGSGRFYEAAKKNVENIGGELMTSEHSGHITEMVSEILVKDPFSHIVVYGGDGSVFETVNGIMQSGANASASFSVIPAGSGNDFSAYANDSGDIEKSELTKIDLIRTKSGDKVRYFANMMNIGFDCDVVRETYSLKVNSPFKGSAAYIAGLVKVLVRKKPVDAEIRLFDEEGNETLLNRRLLLTGLANSRYCGGGFYSAPIASITDGLADAVIVNNVSTLKFISKVSHYRNGTYIDGNGEIIDSMKSVIDTYKCRRAVYSGIREFCLDGEIFPAENGTVEAEVVPGAVWFAAL